MKQIELDASEWNCPEDFYRAFLPALGAPEWHGHNLDAIYDSVFWGGINAVEPPLRVKIVGTVGLPADLRDFLRRVESVFKDGRSAADAAISFDPPL